MTAHLQILTNAFFVIEEHNNGLAAKVTAIGWAPGLVKNTPENMQRFLLAVVSKDQLADLGRTIFSKLPHDQGFPLNIPRECLLGVIRDLKGLIHVPNRFYCPICKNHAVIDGVPIYSTNLPVCQNGCGPVRMTTEREYRKHLENVLNLGFVHV